MELLMHYLILLSNVWIRSPQSFLDTAKTRVIIQAFMPSNVQLDTCLVPFEDIADVKIYPHSINSLRLEGLG